MLALVNVERAHDRSVVSVTSTLPTCEPAEQSLAQSKSELEASEEPHHDEAAETAKLVKRKKGAMKVVADHMIQQVDTVTVNHEMRMSHFKEQLAGLDHASMDDETAPCCRRSRACLAIPCDPTAKTLRLLPRRYSDDDSAHSHLVGAGAAAKA